MSWDDLSMREKAAMMRVAVKNKIFDIDNIKKLYNNYAEGGNFINFIKGHKKEKSESATEALNWVNDYYNSDGFKERLDKLPKYYQLYMSTYYPNSNEEISFSYINPEIPKFNYSNYKESLYNPNSNTVTIGTRWDPDDYFKIASHELGHVYSQGVQKTLKNGITFKGGHYNYYPVFRENPLYQETLEGLKTDYDKRTYQTYPDAIAEKVPHDALPAENYADLIALRAELARNGIYDSTKVNNPFTVEHLKQARERLKSRLFDYFNDDLIILMMNDVAHTTINDSGNNYAANGGRLFNKFDGGGNYTVGNLVDAIYLNNPKEEHLGRPSHLDDLTQSEEWANAHGYYPDAKGHRDDRVKKPAHPSHPSRGTWQGDNFILTDKGFEDPNYTLFGLNDGGQDPLATLIYDGGIVLPEITVTPNGKYINNSYDNIRLHLKSNGGKINRF